MSNCHFLGLNMVALSVVVVRWQRQLLNKWVLRRTAHRPCVFVAVWLLYATTDITRRTSTRLVCRQPNTWKLYCMILIPIYLWHLQRTCLAVCYLHTNVKLRGSDRPHKNYTMKLGLLSGGCRATNPSFVHLSLWM